MKWFVVYFTVVYVFDAQSGKPLGDGKPISHKVRYHYIHRKILSQVYCIAESIEYVLIFNIISSPEPKAHR